jgi:flavin reductase (DIM6/NTAB) family NADH-FMN oxidoreductase RutF
MCYEPGKTPRPIGWISTLSTDGVANFDPPYVMFSANQTTGGERKDSTHNAEQRGEFVGRLGQKL